MPWHGLLSDNVRRADEQWDRWDKRIRDSVLYVVSIGGVINELFIREEIRPYALFFAASVLGIPLAMRRDEKKGKPPEEPEPKPAAAAGT